MREWRLSPITCPHCFVLAYWFRVIPTACGRYDDVEYVCRHCRHEALVTNNALRVGEV